MEDYKDENVWLMQGDCLERMKEIEEGSVDLVLTDPPYGTTACKWDTVIDLDRMWETVNNISHDKSAIVMTASQPFTTILIYSNIKNFKYCWVWEKEQGTNFSVCKHQPLKVHEDICVFSIKKAIYNPQNLKVSGKLKSNLGKGGRLGHNSSEPLRKNYIQQYSNYPKSIQKFNRERGLHPTQKPVALMEYLILTYTNEGDTVLDFTMGSGTTGVACKNLNRKFIGIELDKEYFAIAKERILNS